MRRVFPNTRDWATMMRWKTGNSNYLHPITQIFRSLACDADGARGALNTPFSNIHPVGKKIV